MNQRRQFAFTIVELLVVVAVIGILLALLSSGLSSAIASGKKTKEMNRLKQVLVAWTLYSGQYEDKLMPGFIDSAVQQGPQGSAAWQVRYHNKAGSDLAPELCQTYPWRLAPYLDYSYETFLGYRDSIEDNVDFSKYVDPEVPVTLPASLSGATALDGAGIAIQPAFGYNAYYLGGWWTSVAGKPTVTFGTGGYTEVGTTGVARGRLVAKTLGNISKPSELVVFTSSTFLNQSSEPYSKFNDWTPGAAWAVPPRLGPDAIWGFGGVTLQGVDLVSATIVDDILAAFSPHASLAPLTAPMGEVGKLMVFKDQSIPISRYGKTLPVGLADGGVRSSSADELNDIRVWVPCANTRAFTHTP